jgi:hypothetical protein
VSGPLSRTRRARLAVAAGSLALLAAGCGSQAAVQSSAASTETTAASGSPASAAPTKSPAADPATAAVRAFIAFASKPGASYQATFTGKSRHTVDVLPISKGLLQVSGQNVLVRATFRFPSGAKVTVEHRAVGGKGWAREVPGKWQRLAGFGPAQSMAAFPEVGDLADVTYLGTTSVGGEPAYKVRVRSAILNPVLIPASNLTEVVVTDPSLTVVVDARGRPLSGTAEIVGNGRVSGQLQEIAIDLDVRFTKVGQPVKITAP